MKKVLMAKRESVKKLAEDLGQRTITKWTPERIEALAEDMLQWWLEDETRVSAAAFWATRDDLCWYDTLPAFLCGKSETFLRYHTRVKLIMESRLIHRGMMPKQNPAFIEFMLLNIGSGYVPRNSMNIKNDNRRVELPSVSLSLGQPQPKTIDVSPIVPPNLAEENPGV